MHTPSLQAFVATATQAARRAAREITYAAKDLDLLKIEDKAANDFVTNADRAAEAAIIEELQRAYPRHSILCEESGLIGEDPKGIPNNLMPYVAKVAHGELPYLNVFGNDYPTPDGTGVRDYIHVMDLAEGHLAALEHIDNYGVEAINLGTGVGYSVLDMVKAFEKASGRPVPYKIAPRRAGDIASCYASPEKAAKELNWRAKRNLEDMCRDLWNFQIRKK